MLRQARHEDLSRFLVLSLSKGEDGALAPGLRRCARNDDFLRHREERSDVAIHGGRLRLP